MSDADMSEDASQDERRAAILKGLAVRCPHPA